MARVVAAIAFLSIVLQAAQEISSLETEYPSSELHPVFGNLSSQALPFGFGSAVQDSSSLSGWSDDTRQQRLL
eukprot:3806-Heterococcus_DN1.PRE.1